MGAERHEERGRVHEQDPARDSREHEAPVDAHELDREERRDREPVEGGAVAAEQRDPAPR